MADEKISALTNYPTPIDADLFPIVDTTTPETKNITWEQLLDAILTQQQTSSDPFVFMRNASAAGLLATDTAGGLVLLNVQSELPVLDLDTVTYSPQMHNRNGQVTYGHDAYQNPETFASDATLLTNYNGVYNFFGGEATIDQGGNILANSFAGIGGSPAHFFYGLELDSGQGLNLNGGYLYNSVDSIIDVGGNVFENFPGFSSESGQNVDIHTNGGSDGNQINLHSDVFAKSLDIAGTTNNSLNFDNSASTPSAVGTPPLFSGYYGGSTNALGDPTVWALVSVGGTEYRLPLY